MATTNDTCKVCGAPMESAVCHQCGWTPMLFPARVPKAISDFESERIKVAKETLKNNEELKKQKESLQQVKEDLEQQRQSLEDSEKRVALLTDENTKLAEGQKVLEQQLRAENEKVLKMEADLRKALEKANKSNLSDLKGIVIISDMTYVNPSDMSAYASTSINRQCLPVLSGDNTYGSANSEGNHHQITIKCRGEVFLPKHFAVDTSHSRGLVIKDLSNGRITLNGSSFKEAYAGNSKFFINQGRQKFIIEIKMLNL